MRWARLVLAVVLVVGWRASSAVESLAQSKDMFALEPAVLSEVESVVAAAQTSVDGVDLMQVPIRHDEAKLIERGLAVCYKYFDSARKGLVFARARGGVLWNVGLVLGLRSIDQCLGEVSSLLVKPITYTDQDAVRQSRMWATALHKIQERILSVQDKLETSVNVMLVLADAALKKCTADQ